MKIIGLTGGIGMGKSTASACFRRHRVPIFDADQAVHGLQAVGGRAVDREALRRAVLGNPAALKILERIVHPLVRDAEKRFLAAARRAGQSLVVLDIPLLLETGGEKRVDLVVVVSAPAAVQAARVMRRRGMTAERLAAIRARQMPDAAKRRRADVVIHSGLSRQFAVAGIRRLLRSLRAVG